MDVIIVPVSEVQFMPQGGKIQRSAVGDLQVLNKPLLTRSMPSNSTPTFSVVICTRNRGEELERCLDGICRQKYPYVDVLVVDSAPEGALAFEIARRWRARYVMEPHVGLSRARNLGLCASTGDLIAFLDDDAVPDPDWLERLAVEFKDPHVAAVTGRIRELRTPGEPPNAIGEFYTLDCLGNEGRFLDRENPQWFEIASFGGVGLGSNMAFRRSALNSWSGFDHRLGRGGRISGGEEHYAFFHLVECGYRVVYTPDAQVYHPYPADLRVLRRHHLRDLTALTGYATFLFFEEPNHRGTLVRYAFEALRGVKRPWRSATAGKPIRLISRRRRYSALLLGPFLYLLVRFERGLWFKARDSVGARHIRAATVSAGDV